MTHFVIKCMNKECNNYKQELLAGTEICSLCNTPITKVETNINPKFYKWALLLAFTGFGITAGGGWILAAAGGMTAIIVVDILGFGALIAGVVLGVMSKSKLAIVLPVILALIGIVMTLLMYGIIEF